MDGRVKAPAANNGPATASYSQCVEWYGIAADDCERLLRAAARLIRHNGWAQKDGSRDAIGVRCKFDSPDAAFFSVNGAIMRAQSDLGLDWTHAKAAGAIFEETVGMTCLAFNETRDRTSDDVANAFYRALFRAREYGQGKAA